MELSNMIAKITATLRNIKLKYVIIAVTLIIIVQLIWAYQTIVLINQPVPSQSPVLPKQNKVLNVISLTSPKLQFKIGEIIPVGINIESDKTTAGVDMIIRYDANLLSLLPTVTVPVEIGTIYDEYPLNQVDKKNGIITVSGISTKIEGIIPKGLFGTILFQAKAAGNARVFLEFTKNRTNDTNIIENKTSKDVLEEVRNLDLKIIP